MSTVLQDRTRQALADHAPDVSSYRAIVMPLDREDGRNQLREILDQGLVERAYDTILGQLSELVDTRHPALKSRPDELRRLVELHLDGKDAQDHGTWVYYPWSRRLVHVLPEAEYRELRTSRNRNKITAEEQEILRGLRLGVVGLSVGQATAVTLALEEVGGEYLLADFDRLELSNMNRLRAGVHDIGVNKAVLTAREIAEINPYARVEVYPNGIDESNIDQFMAGGRKLDLLFEECDDLPMKIRLREKARQYAIPVLMETSDRGLLDVERFDLEPHRPILHGLIGNLRAEELKGLSTYEKVPIVLRVIGATTMSRRLAASLVDIEATLKTWPQLASNVVLGGALNTDTARRIALGQFTSSGRYFVDLEAAINDQVQATPELPPADAADAPTIRSPENPLPSLSGSPGELSDEAVRTLVSYAVSAPSGGNCQPWRFVYRRGTFDCYFDPERSRTLLDFQGTASYLALGAAVENLTLAATKLGFAVHLAPFPDPDQTHLVCRAKVVPGGTLSAEDAELVQWIGRRTTNRRLGTRHALESKEVAALLATAAAAGVQLRLLQEPDELSEIGSVVARGERLRLLNQRMHDEMMSEVRWSEREVVTTRDGLDTRTLELTPTDLAGLRMVSNWTLMSLIGKLRAGRGLEQPSRKAVAAASAVGLLTCAGSSATDYFLGGRAMQRVWLQATALGFAFQPMTALLYLFARMERATEQVFSTRELQELEELRRDLLRLFPSGPGAAQLMLFRLARAEPPSARSLRRNVDDVLSIER
jgi:nitroreductase